MENKLVLVILLVILLSALLSTEIMNNSTATVTGEYQEGLKETAMQEKRTFVIGTVNITSGIFNILDRDYGK